MAVLSVRFALYVFDVYIDVFDGRHDCQGNMLDFMKREDSLEKRWNLKLTLNFGGDPSDTASTFLKTASADGYSLYKDDFDAVTTTNDC